EEETSRFFGSPTIADLNGDGSNEIVLGDLLSQEIKVFDTTGSLLWSANIGSGIKASPTVGNIDGDSDLEILFGAEDGYLYAYNHNGNSGSPVSGFPVQINENRILASPLIGDINKDGNNEIFVVASNGRIYARNADGSSMWSASLGDVVDLFGSQEINSEPVIDDLDIDGKNELIIGGYDGRVYVYDEGGNEVWSYKTGDTIVATPVVGNITPEYSGKEVVIGSGDGKLYLLSSDGSRIWERNTNGIIRTAVALADVDSDGYNDIIVGTDQHKLYVYSDWGSEITSWRKSLGGAINGAPVVGDVDYDGENEIVVSSNDSKIYAWDLNGFEVPGWPRTIDISAKDGPVLANLDGDSPLEIVIADFGGNLYIWGADDTLFEIFTPLIESP
ncbi:MAG: PQQ-binding-like beta-propeller repeat protein, partial [Chloroflexota bacterium]